MVANTPPKVKITGIRGSIPSGYLLGRTSSGTGDVELVSPAQAQGAGLTPAKLPPTGPAGGDLAGAYPNPTIPSKVPAGGTTGQVLTKNSGTDYDTAWKAGGAGSSLELTDGTTDLTGVTKITVTGATVGGIAAAATLTIGNNVGTPPTVVQFASNNTGSDAVTFGIAPTSGNCLIAMFFNPSSPSLGSGWTLFASNTSGTDYGVIATKTAGAGESATQTPLASSVGAGCLGVWEIYGATTGPIIASTEAEQSGLFGISPILPLFTNALFLGGIGLVSTSNNISAGYNVTVDHKDTSGTGRQGIYGHADAAVPTGQIVAGFTGTGTPGWKPLGVLLL